MACGSLARRVSWLLVIAAITPTPEAQMCYYPDGSLDASGETPCNAGRHTMCCAAVGPSPDFCRPDGLCQDANNDQYVWRQGCTDRTWQAPECLKLCTTFRKYIAE